MHHAAPLEKDRNMLKDRFVIRRLFDRPLHRRPPNREFRDELVIENSLDVLLAIRGGALRPLHDIIDQGDEA
jgi:hypothetical protein